MAKGFQRSGEWRVGFTNRTIASDVKKKLQRSQLLAKQADEETKKRIQSANEQKAEETRITQNILRVSNYEAQQAAQLSNTIKNLLTETVPSIAKDKQDAERARGAADAAIDDIEIPEAPEEEPELDPDDPAAGNYGLLSGRGFDAVSAAADAQLDITKRGNNLATKIENSNDPFGQEKARKIRGIFSGAYTYGYEAREKALKVEGFSSHLDNELKTNETELLDTKNVRFSINDPNLTKEQLKIASNYILGKWTQENQGDLNSISVDKLLVKPAKESIKDNLKKRFTNIDNEFAADMIAGIDLTTTNAIDGIPGAPDLATTLSSYVDLVKPHLKFSKTSSTGTQAISKLEQLIKDGFSRAKDPDGLEKRLNAALALKSVTPAGIKSLSELHPTKFGVIPLQILKQQVVSSKYTAEKSFQNARVSTSVASYLEEQRKLPVEDRASQNDKFDFVKNLLKENPLATKETLDKTSKIFIDPTNGYDSILTIKGKLLDNAALTVGDIIDPSLDSDAVNEYLKANPQVRILDKLYPDSEKKDVEDVAKNFKSFLANKGKAFTLDNYGNVSDASGTFGIAYSRFLSQIKNRAYELQAEAKGAGKALTYGEAMRNAQVEVQGFINDAQTRQDKNSIYYIEKGLKGTGGFQNLARSQNIYPFLENDNLKNIIVNAKVEQYDPAEDQIYKNLELNDMGVFTDSTAAKLAQIFKIPDYDFAKLQSKAWNIPFEKEGQEPENYDMLKNIMDNSDAASDLRDLQSKGNTSVKTINRMFNDFYPYNERTLTEAWKGLNFTSVIKNEITAQGLELDAGEMRVIDGVTHYGHKFIGLSKNGKFGVTRDPSKLPEGASNPHQGVDIGVTGNYFAAMQLEDGIITDNRSDRVLGVTLEITDKNGVAYRFNHLKNYNPKLKLGAEYNGEVIGQIGNTGASTSPHLDIQKRVDGKLVDFLPDANRLSIGPRLEPTIGKYPFTKRMISMLTKDRNEENPIRGLNVAKALHRYRQDEGLQKNLWDYLNKVSWNSALKKSEGDIHLAARYHVAYILRGDMDLYNLPSINAFANNYIQKLRTQGVLD
tara:strand:- start:780 stop:3968 length:3189 start_codon:yes stop_codon:yes gene_type:complete